MCMNATGDANVPLISPVLRPLVSPSLPVTPMASAGAEYTVSGADRKLLSLNNTFFQ